MEGTGIHDPVAASPPPPRRRGGAIFALLAVIAGFAGGFAAGYAANGDRDDDTVAAVGAEAPARDQSRAGEAAGDSGYEVATTMAHGITPGMPMQPTRERLFKRTSSAGHSVRVYRTEFPHQQPECEEGHWCPPPECMPNAQIEVFAVGEWSIAQGSGALFPVREGTAARVIGTLYSWMSDDEPMVGAIVRTAPGVQTVRLTVGGETDEASPTDDIAVLVVPSPGHDGGLANNMRVEAVDASGETHVLTTATYGGDPACIPPPPPPPGLPEAGEQPDDPAAAEAAVRQLVDDVFGPEDPDAVERLVDDPTGLAKARETLKERYPEQSKGDVTYEVGEIVFTSPTEAVYTFRPVIPNYAEMPFRIGGAHLVDGQWIMTRATPCAMYALGGVQC